MIGRTVGHYQVLEKLGEGGMGVVYKARDTRLGRFVVLKALTADRIADPERRRRFVQEARAASALNHSNIVTVHDLIQEEASISSSWSTSTAGRSTRSSQEGPPVRGVGLRHPDHRRLGPCARGGNRTPRPEADQRHRGCARPGEGPGLRPG
jgi:hypothetical protein